MCAGISCRCHDQHAGCRQIVDDGIELVEIVVVAILAIRRGRATPGVVDDIDVNWQRWETQKTLVVDFVNEHELLPTPGAYLYDVRVENRWKNTFSARLGAEATPLSAPVTLRAGVLYDQSPVGDRNFSVLTPDSDKLGLTAGARYSYKAGSGDRWDFDLAAMHLFLAERDIAPGGDGSAGSDGTILNKPAPSFFHGVTRAGFSLITLAVAWRH